MLHEKKDRARSRSFLWCPGGKVCTPVVLGGIIKSYQLCKLYQGKKSRLSYIGNYTCTELHPIEGKLSCMSMKYTIGRVRLLFSVTNSQIQTEIKSVLLQINILILWKWKWSCSVVSNSLRPHGLRPTRLLHPWDFPGKSTGVGCHFLLPVASY